jgi:hypothetical protein
MRIHPCGDFSAINRLTVVHGPLFLTTRKGWRLARGAVDKVAVIRVLSSAARLAVKKM